MAKFTKEERLAIGKEIYEGKKNLSMAAVEYDISQYTARDYLRLYKASIRVAVPPAERLRDVETA